eukprot:Hpha_TRINITY_DN8680_c0_g1::TRINITY_DN8680_c0_g1_i1::g.168868::m.168868
MGQGHDEVPLVTGVGLQDVGSKDPHWGEPVTGTPVYNDVQQPADGRQRFILQGYKDIWAAVLFVLALIGSFVGMVHALTKSDPLSWEGVWTYDETDPSFQQWKTDHADKYKLLKHLLSTSNIQYWAAGAVAASFAYVMLVLLLMHQAPRRFVCVFATFFALLSAICGFSALASGLTAGSYIFFLFAIVPALWLCCVRRFIPFAGLLLEAAMTIISRWKALIMVAMLELVVLTVYAFLVVVSVKPWYGKYVERFYIDANGDVASDVNTTEDATLAPLAGLGFVALWTTQVIACVVHVTACGVAGTWFFYSASGLPRNATWKSYLRAMTTSFGSICFGSLIVAILQMIRLVLRMLMRNRNAILRCLVMCVLGCLESLMRYFNKWAFVQVAIYGKSYIQAAKATWRMMMDGSIWAGVISDTIVDQALAMVNLLGVIVAFSVSFGFTESIFVSVAASLFTLSTCQVVVGAVDSCIKTVFVCFAEAGPMLAVVQPELVEGITGELTRVSEEE